jgi:crotonobetainyl-CoA:carnitine CoA-transferase CaiB-like acyl-CoA transferase
VISVNNNEEWQRFCRIMGQQELALDTRFTDRPARHRNRDALDRIVEEWTGTKAAEEVMQALQGERIAAGVVQDGADLVKDP